MQRHLGLFIQCLDRARTFPRCQVHFFGVRSNAHHLSFIFCIVRNGLRFESKSIQLRTSVCSACLSSAKWWDSTGVYASSRSRSGFRSARRLRSTGRGLSAAACWRYANASLSAACIHAAVAIRLENKETFLPENRSNIRCVCTFERAD